MTRHLPWLLLAASLLYIGVCTGSPDAEVERLKRENERLSGRLAQVDSAASDSIRTLNRRLSDLAREAERADTVFTATLDTVLAEAPDTLRPVLARLQRAHERQVSSLEETINVQSQIIRQKDRQIAARDSLLAVRDTLVRELDRKANPGLFGKLFDTVGVGMTCGVTTGIQPGCAVGVTVKL